MVDPSRGEPRLGFVPELFSVPGARRTGAWEVGADDLDIATTSAQDHLGEYAKPGGVGVGRPYGAPLSGGDEDELPTHQLEFFGPVTVGEIAGRTGWTEVGRVGWPCTDECGEAAKKKKKYVVLFAVKKLKS